ncbi:Olfactory receptor 888 [Apodemus speciosus]|uniref:Olfactory receptor 888 n=1 Tax=Apodemus speciosus TaxID=105296 RepID=A0ABQ0F4M7_APOSI
MALGNVSSVKEFILLGLTQQLELQMPLFFLFLGIYVVYVMGNLGLIVLIALNPHLHTPMYYFLFNLSFHRSLLLLCHNPQNAGGFCEAEHHLSC